MPVLVAALLRVARAKQAMWLSMCKGTDKHGACMRWNRAQPKRNRTQINTTAWTNLKDRLTEFVRHEKC